MVRASILASSAVFALVLGGTAAFAQGNTICDQVAGAASLSVPEQQSLGRQLARQVKTIGATDPAAADIAAGCIAAGPPELALAYQAAGDTATGLVGAATQPDVQAERERDAGIGDPDQGSTQ